MKACWCIAELVEAAVIVGLVRGDAGSLCTTPCPWVMDGVNCGEGTLKMAGLAEERKAC